MDEKFNKFLNKLEAMIARDVGKIANWAALLVREGLDERGAVLQTTGVGGEGEVGEIL